MSPSDRLVRIVEDVPGEHDERHTLGEGAPHEVRERAPCRRPDLRAQLGGKPAKWGVDVEIGSVQEGRHLVLGSPERAGKDETRL